MTLGEVATILVGIVAALIVREVAVSRCTLCKIASQKFGRGSQEEARVR